MKKINVLIPIPNYFPITGGAELYTKRVAEHLYDNQKANTTIVTRGIEGYEREDSLNGVRIFRVGKKHGNKGKITAFDSIRVVYQIYKKACELLKTEQFDVIHCNGYFSAILGMYLSRKFKVPYVLTFQSADWASYYPKFNIGPIKALRDRSFYEARIVHGVSNHLCNEGRKYGGKDVRFLPNGVDVDIFDKADGSAIREKYGIKRGEKLIITASRLVHKNATDILIRAFGKMKSQTTQKVKLMIVGDGVEMDTLVAQTKELGLEDSVIFAGNAVYTDIPPFFAAADVFCRPSRAEGFGIVFLESMAASAVAIGTATGGIVDIIKDGENGLLVDVENVDGLSKALLSSVEDSELATRLINGGLEHARKHDWSVIAERSFDMYTDASATQKKIVFAAGIYPPDIGGPATYVKHLGAKLKEEEKDVEIVCYSDSQDVDDGDMTVHRVLRGKGHHARYKKAFKKAMKGADTLYFQSPLSSAWPVLSLIKNSNANKIIKIVGDPVWEQARGAGLTNANIDDFQKGWHGIKVWIMRYMLRRVLSAMDHVIVPSKYLATLCEGWGVDKEKITVIYNAAHAIELDSSIVRSDFVFSCGRFVNWKGFDELLDLWKKWKSAPRLEIAGDGPEFKRIKERIAREGLADKIALLGKLSKQEVHNKLQSAKAFVLNTGYEGFSHILLEAMACKCPVVTTNTCGNPELVEYGINGWLYEVGDIARLQELIEQCMRDDMSAITDAALRSLEQFSQAAMEEQTDAILKL